MGFSMILWAFVRLPEMKMGNQRSVDNLAKQRRGAGASARASGDEGSGDLEPVENETGNEKAR
jgi:hypothetical protein